jgi:hypothetical protein
VVWLVAVVSGTVVLLQYQMTPGRPATVSAAEAAVSVPVTQSPPAGPNPSANPSQPLSQSKPVPSIPPLLASDKPTLLMFAHPKCSCSMASIEELDDLMVRCGDRVHARVILFQPIDQPADWSNTRLYYRAQSIRGVQIEHDLNGALAQRFGAHTSGQVFLYDPQGQLLYSGGITGSRGHVGDNAGLDAVMDLLLHPDRPHATPIKFAVFGCSLSHPTRTPESLP